MDRQTIAELFGDVRCLKEKVGYAQACERSRSLEWSILEDARDVHLYSLTGDWVRAEAFRERHHSRSLRKKCLAVTTRNAPDDKLYETVTSETEWEIPKVLRGLRRYRRQQLIDRIVNYWIATNQIHRLVSYLSLGSPEIVREHYHKVQPWMKGWQILQCLRRHPKVGTLCILDRLSRPVNNEEEYERSIHEQFKMLQNLLPKAKTIELYDAIVASGFTAESNVSDLLKEDHFFDVRFERAKAKGESLFPLLRRMSERRLTRFPKRELYALVQAEVSESNLSSLQSFAEGIYMYDKMKRFVDELWTIYGRDRMVNRAIRLKQDEIKSIPVHRRAAEARLMAASYTVRTVETDIAGYSAFLPYEEAWINLRELMLHVEAPVRLSAWETWGSMVLDIRTREVAVQFLQRLLESKHDQAVIHRTALETMTELPSEIWEDEDAESMQTAILNATTAVDCNWQTLRQVKDLMAALTWLHAHWMFEWGEPIMEKVDYHPLIDCQVPTNHRELFNEASLTALRAAVEKCFDPEYSNKDGDDSDSSGGVRTEALKPMKSFPWSVLRSVQIGLPFCEKWLADDRFPDLSERYLEAIVSMAYSNHWSLFERVIVLLVTRRRRLLTVNNVAAHIYKVCPSLIFSVLQSAESEGNTLWREAALWNATDFLRLPLCWQDALSRALVSCKDFARNELCTQKRLVTFIRQTRSRILLQEKMAIPSPNYEFEEWLWRQWHQVTFKALHRMDDLRFLRLIVDRSPIGGDDLISTWTAEGLIIKEGLRHVSPQLGREILNGFDVLQEALLRRVELERHPWRHRHELQEEALKTTGWARAGSVSLLKSLVGELQISAFLRSLPTDDYMTRSDIKMYKRPMPADEERAWWERMHQRLREGKWDAVRRFAFQLLTRMEYPRVYMTELLMEYIDSPKKFCETSHDWWKHRSLLTVSSFGRGMNAEYLLRIVQSNLQSDPKRLKSRLKNGEYEREIYKHTRTMLESAAKCVFDSDRERAVSWLLPFVKSHHILRWLAPEVVEACRGEQQVAELRAFCQSIQTDRALMCLFAQYQQWINPFADVPHWKEVFSETQDVPLLHYLVDRASLPVE